jgi:hypothetical protein
VGRRQRVERAQSTSAERDERLVHAPRAGAALSACRDQKAHAACSFEITVSQDGERFPQPAVARSSSSADEVAAADQIHEGVGRIAERVRTLRPTNAALGIRGFGQAGAELELDSVVRGPMTEAAVTIVSLITCSEPFSNRR